MNLVFHYSSKQSDKEIVYVEMLLQGFSSAFVGKGKAKFFNLFVNNPTYRHALQYLFIEFAVSDSIFTARVQFVCEVYGQSTCASMDEA